MDFIKQREKKAFESEMRAFKHDMKEEVSAIKTQNTRLDEQNIQLLDRNKVLEEQGVRSTRLALTLFALSVAITFAPLVAKKLGYDLDPPAKPVAIECPKPTVIETPKISVYNYHFGGPTSHEDNKKQPSPTHDQKKVPVIMPRTMKLRVQSATP